MTRCHQVPEGFHLRGIAFTLDFTSAQRTRMSSFFGGRRFAYNWGLRLLKDRMDGLRVFAELAMRQGATVEEAKDFAEGLVGPTSRSCAEMHRICAELAMRQGASLEDAKKWANEMAEPDIWTLFGMRKVWNRLKAEEASWWAENSKEVYSSAFSDLQAGLSNWRASTRGTRKGPSVGFPRFKSKWDRQSVTFTTGAKAILDAHHIQIPRIEGPVKVREDLSSFIEARERGELRLLALTVTRDPDGTDRASFGADEADRCLADRANRKAPVRGFDVGIKTPLMASGGKPLTLRRARGMEGAWHCANAGTVGKALGISHRSPLASMVLDAIGTARERDKLPARSVSKAALARFVDAAGKGAGDTSYARVRAALVDEELLATCKEIEAGARSEAAARSGRRRAKRSGRLDVRRREAPEDCKARLEAEAESRRVAHKAKVGEAVVKKRATNPAASAFNRGWALPDPDRLARKERGRRRYDRQLSRQRQAQDNAELKERSKRYQKAKRSRAATCAGQRHARKDFAHKLTIREARRTGLGVVESLATKNLMAKGGWRKRGLNRGLGNAGLSMILTFLAYKLAWYGGRCLEAPRFFPSTKRCSDCGLVAESMPLSRRLFRCEGCGLVIDRDRNAARNLAQLGPVLAFLLLLVATGQLSQSDYDKMIDSWKTDRKTSGPVGPTTETAQQAERLQRRNSGVVLRDDLRSSQERPPSGDVRLGSVV